jgi:tetratricopeptide (TPR) repeat protein
MNYANLDSLNGGLSMCYEAKKDYVMAISLCGEAIQNNPQSADNYNNRGYMYLLAGDYEKALPDIEKALELSTDTLYNWPYLDSRGRYYFKTGDMKKALADLNESLELHSDPIVYCHRAQVYLATGEYEKAVADLSSAVEMDDQYAEAYYFRGLCYKALGRTDIAIADFQSAVRLSGDDSISALATGELNDFKQ